MLIKEIYTGPTAQYDIIELPDGSLYRFNIVPSRALTADDLEPVKLAIPAELYKKKLQPYEGALRSMQMKYFGLTDVPIKAARMDEGMTQQQLADKAGVHIRQIQKVESGEVKAGNMAAQTLLSIADALGADPRSLV